MSVTPRRSVVTPPIDARSCSSFAPRITGVLGAGDEMHRLWDGLARQLRRDLPVTMPVPVQVDRAAEARVRELRHIVVEILLRQPGRQLPRLGQAPDPAASGALWGR